VPCLRVLARDLVRAGNKYLDRSEVVKKSGINVVADVRNYS